MLIHKMLFALTRKRRSCFSPVYYEMHMETMESLVHQNCGCLSVALFIAMVSGLPLLWGYGSVVLASIAGAFAVFAIISAWASTADMFIACVIPFFESEVGNTHTFLSGRHLLWNSRRLDEICVELGVTPLSAFASEDPLFKRDAAVLFDAMDGLITVEALIEAGERYSFSAKLSSDLNKLRNALRKASDKHIRFSLHLREGNTASTPEMEARGGSYF